MKNKKIYLIGLTLVLVLLVVISAVMPKNYETTVTQKLDTPINVAFNAVLDFYSLPLWSHRFQKDTFTYNNNISQEAIIKNELKHADGVFRLIASNSNDSILIYDEGMNKKTTSYNYKFLNKEQTFVEVTGKGKSGFITNLWNFGHKMKLRRVMRKDIKRLNELISERTNNNIYHGYEIKPVSMPDKYFITKKAHVKSENITDFYKQNLASLYQSALNDNLAINGPPVLMRYGMPENSHHEIAVGLPTLSEVSLKNSTNEVLPSKMAYQIVHTGQSTHTQKVHHAMQAFFKDKDLEILYPILEEFPGESSESDSKSVINIVYYFK